MENMCKSCGGNLRSLEHKAKHARYTIRHRKSVRDYQKRNLAAGRCVVCPRKISRRGYCEKHQHLLESRAATRKRVALWRAHNPLSIRAHSAVHLAIKQGVLAKPNKCSRCGRIPRRLEGHHRDYKRPLDVKWLCSFCHRREHGEVKHIA
jgi:hypothetical protein